MLRFRAFTPIVFAFVVLATIIPANAGTVWTLPQLLQFCAPAVSPRTMLAVVTIESGGWPWDIDDDTGRRSYHDSTEEAAIRRATRLLAAGHNLDVGLAQVNSANFAAYHLTVAAAFDPCTNVNVGSTILTRAYQASLSLHDNPQEALYHALERYNSGRDNGAPRYARKVWETALHEGPLAW